MNFLIDLGAKATFAFGLAFLIAFLLRRSSASVRYAMWTCALAAALVLPLASRIGPTWSIARSARRPAIPALAQQTSTSVVVQAGGPASTPARPWIAMIWIAGALGMLVRIVAGHWRAAFLCRTAEEIHDPHLLALAENVAAGIGFRRRVVLRRSTATDVPLSYGLFRATVLLPGDSDQWSDERRRVVLTHEMTHARRLDSLWSLIEQCALAVNWFHPLAWLAVKEFRKEQERSCDDAVVTAGTESAVYAAHLVDLARSIAIPEPALGMAERFNLEGRVHALLDPGRTRKAASRRLCVAMFAMALATIIPLAAVHAQMSSPKHESPTGYPPSLGTMAPQENGGDSNDGSPVEAEPLAATAEQTNPPSPQTAAPQATFAGAVYDPSGAIIPGAMVTLENITASGSKPDVTLTNSAGQFKFKVAPDAQYRVRVTAPGFAQEEMMISIDAGRTGTVDLPLKLGEVKEAVEIVGQRPASREISSAAPKKIRVGGNVRPISLISKVSPEYPADARAEGVEGTVMLRAVVSKDGRLLNVKVVNGTVDQRLATAAVDAVQLWQYQPALLNNEPVEVLTTIAVAFRLN